MAKMCIICENESPQGYELQDTPVIQGIRRLKAMLGRARHNTLVVCSTDVAEYKKRRSAFERKLLLMGGLGGGLVLIAVVLPLLWGRLPDLGSSVLMVLLALFLAGLSLLHYVPPLRPEVKLPDDSPSAAKPPAAMPVSAPTAAAAMTTATLPAPKADAARPSSGPSDRAAPRRKAAKKKPARPAKRR